MSRVAKSSITIPTSVEVIIDGNLMSVKGKLGQLNMSIHPCVAIVNTNSKLSFNIITIEKKEQKKLGLRLVQPELILRILFKV